MFQTTRAIEYFTHNPPEGVSYLIVLKPHAILTTDVIKFWRFSGKTDTVSKSHCLLIFTDYFIRLHVESTLQQATWKWWLPRSAIVFLFCFYRLYTVLRHMTSLLMRSVKAVRTSRWAGAQLAQFRINAANIVFLYLQCRNSTAYICAAVVFGHIIIFCDFHFVNLLFY